MGRFVEVFGEIGDRANVIIHRRRRIIADAEIFQHSLSEENHRVKPPAPMKTTRTLGMRENWASLAAQRRPKRKTHPKTKASRNAACGLVQSGITSSSRRCLHRACFDSSAARSKRVDASFNFFQFDRILCARENVISGAVMRLIITV